MYIAKISNLLELKSDYDIFTATQEIEKDLVRLSLVPPLPVSGDFLIWGFPIVRMAAGLQMETLQCIDVENCGVSYLQLALQLERRCDRYTWEEKKGILSLLRRDGGGVNEREISRLVQTDGSFVPNTEKYCKLPLHIQRLVNGELIDLKTAGLCTVIPEEAVREGGEVMDRFSFSSRRQFFVMLAEIIKRDSLSHDEAAAFARELYRRDDPLTAVRLERYPNLGRMERDVDDFRSRFLTGTGVKLQPPPRFEGDGFTLSIEWKSEKQLERAIHVLREIKSEGNRLFKLLF